ncbi:MAG: DUF1847 domain-containing protein [Synergistales bacterium]|nr:DUF1847 domain-containing protein [Synergistales bacterium]
MRCDQCTTKSCEDEQPCIATDSLPLYEESEDHRMLQVAGEVEARFYEKLGRFDEILEFSRRMGYRTLGMAFCIGLAEEAAVAGRIIEREFAFHSVCCKVGGVLKADLGLISRPWIGTVTCNPKEQARILNEAGTDLNIILGLCVGHDALFTKASEAPVTTLAAKDRTLGHNPLAAVYCPYLRRHLGKAPVERTEV